MCHICTTVDLLLPHSYFTASQEVVVRGQAQREHLFILQPSCHCAAHTAINETGHGHAGNEKSVRAKCVHIIEIGRSNQKVVTPE